MLRILLHLPNLFKLDFQLRRKLEKVCDQPEEVRLVHARRRVREELPVETHDEAGVTFQQEVDGELLQQVGNVIVRWNVVN